MLLFYRYMCCVHRLLVPSDEEPRVSHVPWSFKVREEIGVEAQPEHANLNMPCCEGLLSLKGTNDLRTSRTVSCHYVSEKQKTKNQKTQTNCKTG